MSLVETRTAFNRKRARPSITHHGIERIQVVLLAATITLAAVAAGLSRGLPGSGYGVLPGSFLLLWGLCPVRCHVQDLLAQWCRISGLDVALASCLVFPYLAYSLPLHCFSAKDSWLCFCT
jgi:hypothetical protein